MKCPSRSPIVRRKVQKKTARELSRCAPKATSYLGPKRKPLAKHEGQKRQRHGKAADPDLAFDPTSKEGR